MVEGNTLNNSLISWYTYSKLCIVEYRTEVFIHHFIVTIGILINDPSWEIVNFR